MVLLQCHGLSVGGHILSGNLTSEVGIVWLSVMAVYHCRHYNYSVVEISVVFGTISFAVKQLLWDCGHVNCVTKNSHGHWLSLQQTSNKLHVNVTCYSCYPQPATTTVSDILFAINWAELPFSNFHCMLPLHIVHSYAYQMLSLRWRKYDYFRTRQCYLWQFSPA